jgi:hypothetical protein
VTVIDASVTGAWVMRRDTFPSVDSLCKIITRVVVWSSIPASIAQLADKKWVMVFDFLLEPTSNLESQTIPGHLLLPGTTLSCLLPAHHPIFECIRSRQLRCINSKKLGVAIT